MKKSFTYGLLVTTALLLGACSSKGSQSSGSKQKTLNVSIAMEPSTADPNTYTDVYSGSMLTQTLEGLYHTTNTGKVVPGVATKLVKPTDHGTTYTFNLRNCLRSKLSFGILLQKRKLLCLIIPVILLANSLKSFAQN